MSDYVRELGLYGDEVVYLLERKQEEIRVLQEEVSTLTTWHVNDSKLMRESADEAHLAKRELIIAHHDLGLALAETRRAREELAALRGEMDKTTP